MQLASRRDGEGGKRGGRLLPAAIYFRPGFKGAREVAGLQKPLVLPPSPRRVTAVAAPAWILNKKGWEMLKTDAILMNDNIREMGMGFWGGEGGGGRQAGR